MEETIENFYSTIRQSAEGVKRITIPATYAKAKNLEVGDNIQVNIKKIGENNEQERNTQE